MASPGRPGAGRWAAGLRPGGGGELVHKVGAVAIQGEGTVGTNRSGDTSDAGPAGAGSYRNTCACFDQWQVSNRRRARFHSERQDTSAPGWQHLVALVEEAAADGREVFRPLVELSPSERRQIITLPASIAKLTAVRHLVLYGSNLVRLPPEIGAMTSLEKFTPYTSYRLHWLPYELTRCHQLVRSTVSTRALYGNHKLRPPFPPLHGPRDTGDLDLSDLDPGAWGADAVRACSVCDRPIHAAGIRQAWVSLQVATDVLPLLVNTCSTACIQALPSPPEGYIPTPHTGGPTLTQPPADYA